jgi:hypothetical protein
MDQQHYVGLDGSLETTSICVVDKSGAIVWRGKCSTEREPISQGGIHTCTGGCARRPGERANVELADPSTAQAGPARRLP